MGYELISIIVFAGLCFALLISIVERWPRPSQWNYNYKRKIEEVPRTATALIEEYLSYHNKNVVRSVAFIVPISIFSSILARDFSSVFVGLSYCAIILAFLALTKYRVKHRYFAAKSTKAQRSFVWFSLIQKYLEAVQPTFRAEPRIELTEIAKEEINAQINEASEKDY